MREAMRRLPEQKAPSFSLTIDQLQSDLHLKPEQAEKVQPILRQMDDELSNLRLLDLRETDGIFSRAKDRIDPILTPEQRPKLQQIIDERQRRARQWVILPETHP